MLPARKTRLTTFLLDRLLIRPSCRAGFNTVNYRERAGRVPLDIPLIVVANHSSWWDPYLVSCYNQMLLGRDMYIVAEDKQLQRYQMFRYGGGFGVSRTDGRDAARSIAYAARLLQARRDRVIIIFPQGEILANDSRPLSFSRGAVRMATGLSSVAFLPLAIRLEFIGEQKPDAFLSAGDPVVCDSTQLEANRARELTERLRGRLTAELDTLRDDVVAYRFSTFTTMLRSRPSINRLVDAASGRTPMAHIGPA